MQKNILIIKSSPRKHGNSSVLADQVALGAQAQGATAESFQMADMHINPCDACDSCQETHGVCVIQDDMQALYPKIQKADVLVLASPIYWFTFSTQLKTCIDRQQVAANLTRALEAIKKAVEHFFQEHQPIDLLRIAGLSPVPKELFDST